MGKKDLQRYIKITKIEIIFADTLQHLVMTTFRVCFPYIKSNLSVFNVTNLHPKYPKFPKIPYVCLFFSLASAVVELLAVLRCFTK